MAAATLEDTLAVLRGLRVEITARIDQLARLRSAESLMERAREEVGGLPETATEARLQTDERRATHEVDETPGLIAREARRQSEAASTAEVEAGPVLEDIGL
jgi:hypothetical protein